MNRSCIVYAAIDKVDGVEWSFNTGLHL